MACIRLSDGSGYGELTIGRCATTVINSAFGNFKNATGRLSQCNGCDEENKEERKRSNSSFQRITPKNARVLLTVVESCMRHNEQFP